MIAHMRRKIGKLGFSGFNACGDPWAGAGIVACRTLPALPFDAIVDVGVDFVLTSDEPPRLYVLSPGPIQFTAWMPESLLAASRVGWFGFKLIAAA